MSEPQALVIDDNSKNVSVLTRLLATQGLATIQVTHPTKLASALEQVEDVKVVFLDLEMPGTDGFQVLSQLKSDSRFEATPIIAYTVHISEIHVAHERGFSGMIGKPLDADRFPDQLARILKGEAVWEAQ